MNAWHDRQEIKEWRIQVLRWKENLCAIAKAFVMRWHCVFKVEGQLWCVVSPVGKC